MGNVVSGIFHGIGSAISHIIDGISTVVKGVFNVISKVISGLFNFLFNTQIGAFLGIAAFLLPQAAMWNVGKLLFHIERFLPIPIETRMALQLKTLSLFGKLQGWQSSIWSRVGAVTSSVYKIYKYQKLKLKLYLWDVTDRINEALGFNLGQLIGGVYHKLSEANKVLNKAVQLAYIYDRIKQKKYFQAFYCTIDYLDASFKSELDHTIVYVKSLIDGAYRELHRTVTFVNTILGDVQAKTYTFENSFRKLAKFTGVEAFEDIADGLDKYIIDNINDVRHDVYKGFTTIRGALYSPETRVHQLWNMKREWDKLKREEKASLRIWEFNPFVRAHNRLPLLIAIPTPIAQRL